mmetsp:Transcript_81110/g.131412  ORF Transcript_81110/g.131412 Transcript_81110/m.131412 type:complete len:228 (+) Transcript_81110:740-1423(+)
MYQTHTLTHMRLHAQMHTHKSDVFNQNTVVKTEMQEAAGILSENVQNMLSRSERLDVVVCKSEELALESRRFKQQTTKLATRLSCQAVFFRVLCILLALAVGIVICFILSACGRKYFSEIGSDYDLYCPPFQSSISSMSTPAKAALDDASAAVATVSGDAVTAPVTAATRTPLFNRLATGFHPPNRHATAVDEAVGDRVGGGDAGESGGGQSGLQIGPGLHWQWVQH